MLTNFLIVLTFLVLIGMTAGGIIAAITQDDD